MSNQLTVQTHQVPTTPSFTSGEGFALASRMAEALAKSTLVPSQYQGSPSNCLIALELANRMKLTPLMLMQQLNIVHGKPTPSASLVVALLNASGRFSQLRWRMEGEGDKRTCIAYATDRETGEVLEGTPVSIEMAKKEQWYTRSGSKWPSMPEQMLRYRAATFFGRLYAPDLLMGFQTADELGDIHDNRQAAKTPEYVDAVVQTVAVLSQAEKLAKAFTQLRVQEHQITAWGQVESLEQLTDEQISELRAIHAKLKSNPSLTWEEVTKPAQPQGEMPSDTAADL